MSVEGLRWDRNWPFTRLDCPLNAKSPAASIDKIGQARL